MIIRSVIRVNAKKLRKFLLCVSFSAHNDAVFLSSTLSSSRKTPDFLAMYKTIFRDSMKKENSLKSIPTDEIMEISSEVLESMIKAALETKDLETLEVIVVEAVKLNKLSRNMIEEALRQCLAAKQPIVCSKIVSIAFENGIILQEELYQHVLSKLVGYLKWKEAGSVIAIMINLEYAIKDRAIYFVIGGLLSSRTTVSEAIQLVTQIIVRRKDDLSRDIHINGIRQFARTQSNGSIGQLTSHRSEGILMEAMKECVDALVVHGWFSPNIFKFLIAFGRANTLQNETMKFIE